MRCTSSDRTPPRERASSSTVALVCVRTTWCLRLRDLRSAALGARTPLLALGAGAVRKGRGRDDGEPADDLAAAVAGEQTLRLHIDAGITNVAGSRRARVRGTAEVAAASPCSA
jgi:hypothetical protein